MVHSLTPPQYNRLSPSGLSRSPLTAAQRSKTGMFVRATYTEKINPPLNSRHTFAAPRSRLDAVPVRASLDAGFAGICVVAAPGSLRHLSGHTSRCDLLAIHGSCQGWPVHAGSAPREGSPSCRRSLPARNRSHRLAITVLRWCLASLSYSNSVVRPSASTRRRSKSFAPTVRRPGIHLRSPTRPPPLGRLHSSLQTASTARCSRRSSRRPRPSAPTSASSLELVLLSGSRTAFGWSFRCVGGGREVQCARRCSPDRHRSLLLSGPSLSAPLTWAPGRCGCPLLNNAFAESPCVESAVRSTL